MEDQVWREEPTRSLKCEHICVSQIYLYLYMRKCLMLLSQKRAGDSGRQPPVLLQLQYGRFQL